MKFQNLFAKSEQAMSNGSGDSDSQDVEALDDDDLQFDEDLHFDEDLLINHNDDLEDLNAVHEPLSLDEDLVIRDDVPAAHYEDQLLSNKGEGLPADYVDQLLSDVSVAHLDSQLTDNQAHLQEKSPLVSATESSVADGMGEKGEKEPAVVDGGEDNVQGSALPAVLTPSLFAPTSKFSSQRPKAA
eukprot:3873555-Rhodomonas_salina.2